MDVKAGCKTDNGNIAQGETTNTGALESSSFTREAGQCGTEVPKVSVIIPVYNVAGFLRECLDSVLAQTMKDIEVICVNDGSTDESLSILCEYEGHDSRIRVIDKPNGGYGSAVNRGIEESAGEYVSVVEPDDFISSDMYSDLYAAAYGEGLSKKRNKLKIAKDRPADIVKSSYWNYYDLDDGEAPYIERSNLMDKMPEDAFSFTIHDHWEVLYHHPSIWSAIYRRDFLNERGIRMIEPKGAGWADNPFLYETLCQARSIVWVPGAYYYYRQTNPESSSYLKDYHLPFDRLRDIRNLLDRMGETDPHVLTCFYNRTFDYIKSVLEKFYFSEKDPELFSLIKEAISSIDPAILYSAKKGITRYHIEYYEDVMGKLAKKVKRHKPAFMPTFSIVVAMKDVRPYVFRSLRSWSKQSFDSFEVICVDCGSKDRSAEVASYFSERDGRFGLIEAKCTIPRGFAYGLRRAKGKYVYFANPKNAFGKKFLEKLARVFEANESADFVEFAKELKYFDDISDQGKEGSLFSAAGIRDRLILAAESGVSSKAFKASFLRQNGLHFDPMEGSTCPLMSVKAIAQAFYVALLNDCAPKPLPYRSVRTALALVGDDSAIGRSRSCAFDAMIEYASESGEPDIIRGTCGYIVEAMLEDMSDMKTLDDEEKYLEIMRGTLGRIEDAFGSNVNCRALNSRSFRKLQHIASLSHEQYLIREVVVSREETKKLTESDEYAMGKLVSAFALKVLPKKVAVRAKGMV